MQQNYEDNYISFPDLESASGEIPFGMTNDYMFRAVLQENNKVLRGFVGSLLRLSEEDMLSVEITNPIVLGSAIENKEFRLDINVLLNNHKLINLEMQVNHYSDWCNRSLSYLCRSYDRLTKGQNYSENKPVIHIGILDFTLFTNYPEFYASYKMMNIKNGNIYSDNFGMNVLDLTKIELANDVDKEFKLDYWARLFKAKTWEELKMVVSDNQYLKEASKSMFILSADEEIRKRCRDREDYYADLRNMQNKIDTQAETITEQASTITEQASTITEQASTIIEQASTIAKQASALAEKDNALAEKDIALAEQAKRIAELEKRINGSALN